jgi:hypothetical protein
VCRSAPQWRDNARRWLESAHYARLVLAGVFKSLPAALGIGNLWTCTSR